LSRLTKTETLEEFPATSVHVPGTDWFSPSVVTMTGLVREATPDNESTQLKLTVTSELFQPLAFGGGEVLAVILGGVLSRFTETVTVAEFPALSVHVPMSCWSAPSIRIKTGGVREATPEPPSLSSHSKLTTTSELFQPLAFGVGVVLAVMIGGSVSSGGSVLGMPYYLDLHFHIPCFHYYHPCQQKHHKIILMFLESKY